MEKQILAPGIYCYKNVFEDTQKIIKGIELFFGRQYSLGGIYSGDDSANSKVDLSSRNVDTFAMSDSMYKTYSDNQKNIYDAIKNPMINCLHDYKKDFGFQDQILIDDCWTVLRYGIKQKFENHADDGHRYPRTVSITAYLNSDYEGGEIEYKNFDLSVKPEAGDVLLFPSNYVYQHRVVPVESGVRYAIVNWFRWYTLPKDILSGDDSGVRY